jgi:hypothetical protein
MCCNPFTENCIVEPPVTQSVSEICLNFYSRHWVPGSGWTPWHLDRSVCSSGGGTSGTGNGGHGSTGGDGNTGGGNGSGSSGSGTGSGGGPSGDGSGRTDTGSNINIAKQNIPNPVWIYDGNGPVTGPFGPSSMSNDGGKIIFYFGGFPQMGEILNTNLSDIVVVYTKPTSPTDGIYIWVPGDMPPIIRSKYEIAARTCQNTYDGWAAVAQSDAVIAGGALKIAIVALGGTGALTSGVVEYIATRYGAKAAAVGAVVAGYSKLEDLGISDPVQLVVDIVEKSVLDDGLRIAQQKFVDCMVTRLSR